MNYWIPFWIVGLVVNFVLIWKLQDAKVED